MQNADTQLESLIAAHEAGDPNARDVFWSDWCAEQTGPHAAGWREIGRLRRWPWGSWHNEDREVKVRWYRSDWNSYGVKSAKKDTNVLAGIWFDALRNGILEGDTHAHYYTIAAALCDAAACWPGE